MHRVVSAVCRVSLAVAAIQFLTAQSGRAQQAPPVAPSSAMPGNALARMVPYEQAMKNIEAQDAARPKANEPLTSPPDIPAVSNPPIGDAAPPR